MKTSCYKNSILPLSIVTRLLAAVICIALAQHESRGAKVLAGDYYDLMQRSLSMSASEGIRKGDLFLKQNHQDSALVHYMVACDQLKTDTTQRGLDLSATAHIKAGTVFFNMGNFANAAEYFVSGLRVYERCHTRPRMGEFYKSIGNIHMVFWDLDVALDYYRKGAAECRKYGDRVNLLKIYLNMTNVYLAQNKPREARKYLTLADRINDRSDKALNIIAWYSRGKLNLAEDSTSAGDEKALRIFFPLLDYCERTKADPRYICSSCEQIYRIYIRQGKREKAFEYMNKCLEAGEKYNVRHSCVTTLRFMADYYQEQGDYFHANAFRERYIVTFDSIYNQREFDKLKNSIVQFDMDKKMHRIGSLQADLEEEHATITRQRLTIAVIVVVALLVVLLLMKVWRQKKQLNDSYDHLFKVNRSYLVTIGQMEERLAAASAQADDEEEAAADATETEREPENRSDFMSEAQKTQLLNSVASVMDRTEEYCNPDFSLSRLSQLAGSNNRYVSIIINDNFGKNFNNYVNEHRVRLACVRLADTGQYRNYSVRGVAESVGFRNYSTFVKAFRKFTGLTPSLYKKKLLEETAG